MWWQHWKTNLETLSVAEELEKVSEKRWHLCWAWRVKASRTSDEVGESRSLESGGHLFMLNLIISKCFYLGQYSISLLCTDFPFWAWCPTHQPCFLPFYTYCKKFHEECRSVIHHDSFQIKWLKNNLEQFCYSQQPGHHNPGVGSYRLNFDMPRLRLTWH